MKKRNFRYIILVIIIVVVCLFSTWLVKNTSISSFELFKTTGLFTYFGVLIGFSLTIYTFGLSMVSDTRKKIEDVERFTKKEKDDLYSILVDGFIEIKQDIWIMFFSSIIVIVSYIFKEYLFRIGSDLCNYNISETVNLALFIISTLAMFDIMKTLFNLSEINLELIKTK